MTKRKKVTPKAESILSLEEANIALAEIAGKTRELDVIEAGLNAKIDLAKAEAESSSKQLKDRIVELELGITSFALANKDGLFKKRKTVSLAYGDFGFRKSTELKPVKKHTWKMVLGKLQNLGERAGIRVKEEVNREVLHTWPDARLKTVHVQRIEKDEFWYEIAKEALGETEAA